MGCFGVFLRSVKTVMSSVGFWGGLSALQSEGGEGVFFLPLVETLGPRSEPVALPGSLFKEITQSPHLCCIMGLSERPCTLDVPARHHTDGFLTHRINMDRNSLFTQALFCIFKIL